MKILVILIVKILSFIGGIVGKGSSLPGAVALKLCPSILSKVKLPSLVIAVTGSNGKTSVAEMVSGVLSKSGKNVLYNKEGSNQIEGVTTLLLKNATLSGKVNADAIVLESDERYSKYTFNYIKPSYLIVTNICRDQMTRNGHPFFIYNCLKEAVDKIPDAHLILNGDDPVVRQFGLNRENVSYFGIDSDAFFSKETDAVYNDCYYCPICKHEMSYEGFIYSHLGHYSCPHCGFARPAASFSVESSENNYITINGEKIELSFTSLYNIYNLCAAFSVCTLAGCEPSLAAKQLSSFVLKNGRMSTFKAGKNEATLLISKHENSTSYNTNLGYVVSQKHKVNVILAIDAISRKYYTADSSWIWDISFEKLKSDNVNKIYLGGKFAYELAERLLCAGIDEDRLSVSIDLNSMAKAVVSDCAENLYALTCFSDKEKVVAAFNTVV